MPADIPNHVPVALESGYRVTAVIAALLRHVPKTYQPVVAAGQKLPGDIGIPCQTIAFSLMPTQRHVWTRCVGCGPRWVLADVEHVNVGGGGLGGDDEWSCEELMTTILSDEEEEEDDETVFPSPNRSDGRIFSSAALVNSM